MTELLRLVEEITKLNILKGVFSVPMKKDSEYVKCNLRPMGDKYQFESFTKTQAFHENVAKDRLCDKICSLLTVCFRQAEIFTDEYIYGIKISSKGKLLHNRRRNTEVKKENITHNREKNHIIDLDNAPPVLCDIGVIGKDGKIINSADLPFCRVYRRCCEKRPKGRIQHHRLRLRQKLSDIYLLPLHDRNFPQKGKYCGT